MDGGLFSGACCVTAVVVKPVLTVVAPFKPDEPVTIGGIVDADDGIVDDTTC